MHIASPRFLALSTTAALTLFGAVGAGCGSDSTTDTSSTSSGPTTVTGTGGSTSASTTTTTSSGTGAGGAGSSCADLSGPAPATAADAGYTCRTFYEPFDDISKAIDVNNTKAPGYSFYPFTFLGRHALDPSDFVVENGAFELAADNSGFGAAVITAHPAENSEGWEGTVFGGGAYFEATLSFDPANSDGSFPWPAWWADPIEGLADKGADQWPGQDPGYTHAVELDFFEYDHVNAYGTAFHEWYGPNGPNKKKVTKGGMVGPRGTTWTEPHKYGCLWIPYDEATDTPGSLEMWFDGTPQMPHVTWTAPPANAVPPPSDPWIFAQTDQGHYALMLGTGNGQPITVYEVQVWQKP